MPRVWTVAEIKKAEVDDPVHSFKGTVSNVGAREIKGGEGEKAWRFRTVKVKDPSGAEIECKFWKRDIDPASWNGQPIIIIAKHDAKKGWMGCETGDYKNVRQLVVQPSAEVIVGNKAQQHEPDSGSQKNDPEAEPGERNQNKSSQAATAPDRTDIEDPVKALRRARVIAARAANAYQIALDTAMYVGAQFEQKHGIEMEADQFRVMTSSIFIHLVDSFIITNLPTKPYWEVLGEPSPSQIAEKREKDEAEADKKKGGKK